VRGTLFYADQLQMLVSGTMDARKVCAHSAPTGSGSL